MIDGETTTAIRRRLAVDAEALTGAVLPIDLKDLLDALGIGLRGDPGHVTKADGGLEFRDGMWSVVIPRSGPIDAASLKPRERFTVAHEVAHYLVEARFGYRPGNKREYWSLEEVCNDFASNLLLPAHAIKAFVDPAPSSAAELADRTMEVARSGGVSFEAAARRMLALLPDGACIASILRAGRDAPYGAIGWVAQNREWLNGGRGRKLAASEPLASVTTRRAWATPGERAGIQLDGASDAVLWPGNGVVMLAAILGADVERTPGPVVALSEPLVV
jgi:hypothetical protein